MSILDIFKDCTVNEIAPSLSIVPYRAAHLDDRDPKDILSWFNYNRARKEETNANSVH